MNLGGGAKAHSRASAIESDNAAYKRSDTAARTSPVLLVHRIRGGRGRFALRVIKGRQLIETITAANAQLLLDYLHAEWPVGTRALWIVTP